MSSRILIAEDERNLVSFLEKALRAAGYATTTVTDGPSAIALARDEDFELLILDLGLPILDGTEVLKTLRAQGRRLPVIILSARDDVRDKVAGLQLGADDYLTKPFELDELLARMRALHRRATQDATRVLEVDGLRLDPAAHRVTRDGVEVALSAREFSILHLLMSRAGQVVSRFTILDEVWDGETDLRSNVIDVHVASLRTKIDKPWGSSTITTVRGVGYRVDEAGR